MPSKPVKIGYVGDKKLYYRFIYLNALLCALEGREVKAREMLDEMLDDYYIKIRKKYNLEDGEDIELVKLWLTKPVNRKFKCLRKLDLEELVHA